MLQLPASVLDLHRYPPGASVRIDELPTHGREFHADRKKAEFEFKKLRRELMEQQRRLYAENQRRLLIVFQAMDAAGKDGVIRHVFRGVNPQGVHVTSFKAPTHEELARDYLWRVHRAVPPAGFLGVFNRSHYEDVLIVRVERLASEEVWRRRFDHINAFEKMLSDEGARVLKFFLNISKSEQKKRFQERLQDHEKFYKFSSADVEKRKHWEDYMIAYEEVLQKCSTEWAPWYVIPANQKWYRNLAVMRIITATLRAMNPQYPAPEPGLEQLKVD